MPPLIDTRHTFFADRPDDSVCRVRVWEATGASHGLPILVLTELEGENLGMSVTNAIEQLVGECVTRYLPERDGAAPPCIVVEHYPNRQIDRRSWSASYEESFDTVTFDGWHLEVHPRQDYTERAGPDQPQPGSLPTGWRWLRRYQGEPQWVRVSRARVEQLIGERFPDQSAAEGRAAFEAAWAEHIRRLQDEADA